MAARTSLQFIRPSIPPRLAGPVIAEAIGDIAKSGLIAHHVGQVVQLRYGKRVDADRKTTVETAPTAARGVVRVVDYPWDSEQDVGTIETVIRHLQLHAQPLYRAYVGLGEIDDGIAEYLTRPADAEHPKPMALSTLAFEVGSICVGSPQVRPRHVGWMALTISGRGWPFPWTDQDVIARARAFEAVESVARMLSARWPVRSCPGFLERLSWRRIANRMEPDVPGVPGWIWAVSST